MDYCEQVCFNHGQIEFCNNKFFLFAKPSVLNSCQSEGTFLILSPENAIKTIKDLGRVQKIAQKLQACLDRQPMNQDRDEIDGIPAIQYTYGYTVAIQDFSLVRILMGKRQEKIEIWLQQFYIHHSNPSKIRPSIEKIQFDIYEDLFYLENFIRDSCSLNFLYLG